MMLDDEITDYFLWVTRESVRDIPLDKIRYNPQPGYHTREFESALHACVKAGLVDFHPGTGYTISELGKDCYTLLIV